MEEYNKNEENTQDEEVEEVHLSKKKTGIILVGVLVVVLIILFSIKGCSITKKVKAPSNSTTSTNRVNQSSLETTSKMVEVQSKNEEKTTVFVESSSSSSEGIKVGNSEESTTEKVNSDISFEKVNEPVLSKGINTSGIVSGKSIYKVGNSYMYAISLVIVTGNENNSPCKYFCPKNTWDALSIGDTVKTTFQSDSQGNISINTISK